jgi:putative PEP-CTERM system histidine kinase
MAAVLDESGLCGAASRLVSEIFHTLSVSIWLFDGQRQRLTCVSSTFHLDLEGQSNLHHEVGSELASMTPHQLSRPFELRETKENWMEALREISVGRFRTGGDPLCVPLVAGENWLGIIILADRVGGVRYTAEELDLLKCIGDQVAVNLLNVELTREKMAGKELEAFQTISAFFIHDLKNAASTLSLMLQNLPLHFDDPLFRQDALRGIGSTADRINHLISRLGALRHEPQLKIAEVDLNRIVSESLTTLNGALQANLKTDLAPLERISGDEEQLRSVMTNLFLNAGDAVGGGGQIRVETKQEGRWALLSILDNGCGMSPAFMKDSLFRPFRTTKKKGLGIGMFQAKIIIEAHGGKIEIKSDVGIGTTVRVMLPSARPHQ